MTFKKNQQVLSRTKHVYVRDHNTRELILEERLDIRFVRSE